MNKKIGTLRKEILKLFGIELENDLPILIGELNIEHIKNEHPEDYAKYGNSISEILNNPTYVAKHPEKTSLEYIKEYMQGEELVLVAVRITPNQTSFVKTMFVMSEEKKKKYIKGGYLKKVIEK